MASHTNHLAQSQSPYLLQHANNPVNWYPWGEEALKKAKEEDKPIIVSIGYSACHWCHVMERECFEDEEVAEWMNRHFISIKIDREERPDLDNIYMDALQSMGLQGGWPLNVFVTPEQKPFYGGTYFPKKNWMQLLKGIAEAFQSNREKLDESADGFGRSLQDSVVAKYGLTDARDLPQRKEMEQAAQLLIRNFDPKWGGLQRVPKFPMPAIWAFLLDYGLLKDDEPMLGKVIFTLRKIGMGGIYDAVGGGFARYSVDGEWFAPHFEKMLYDNGQLLSLFSKAYQVTQDVFFKEKVLETSGWLKREMQSPDGGFYAALDADSEGEEGKYYCWTYEELKSFVGEENMAWFQDLYSLKVDGNWENGVNILFQTKSYEKVAKDHGLEEGELKEKLSQVKAVLLEQRSKRVSPGLDDKQLSGWNAWAIIGLVQAYRAVGDRVAYELALQATQFLTQKMMGNDILYRSYKSGKAYTPAFLEDYAAVIQALIEIYQVDFDFKWLETAKTLMTHVNEHFWDEKEGLYFYNDPKAEKLIADKKEIFDNVIPSSNALMAKNLHLLGSYFQEDKWVQRSKKMLGLVSKLVMQEPGFMSQWANVLLSQMIPTAEIAVVGEHAKDAAGQLLSRYHPNIILSAGGKGEEHPPLLSGKELIDEATTFYVCYNRSCRRPVTKLEEAISQLPTWD
ncbi:thioredoxin domain-containing protein [Pleomorphovibrio marinus]|uniref:thioredoxin domain-containing protein n=1 Tax=Pleomorphovibrio marinus TaxID=2164132 RepID=UPI000E0CB7B3|nr:thioredoxin domain-containing protein [Pleomorphovibrio marinus]